MINVSKLCVRRYRDRWCLADDKGPIIISARGMLLADIYYYCKIHKVKTVDKLKERFTDDVFLFVR